jgi:outer membrane receptor protein involved in Fe transport
LGRSYRIPSFSELDSSSYVFDPDFPRIGNPELVPEFVWRQEAGVRYRDLSVTLYRNDYENYIQDRWYPFGQYFHTVNIPRASILGVETALDLPLAWGFRLGFGGDYLIDSESELIYPKYRAGAELYWRTERGRARFKIFGRGRYLSPDVPGGANLRPVFTLGALIRFVTLTGSLRIENLLDDANPDFPVPERDISLSVKWEFLD